jgi:hypothetical protein
MFRGHHLVMRRLSALILVGATIGAACAGSDDDGSVAQPTEIQSTEIETTEIETRTSEATTVAEVTVPTGEQLFPDVIDATAEQTNLGWTFNATVSSPYDSADRYADAWRIVGPDGTVYGTRELAHDHSSEQPFTRTIQAIEIPDDVQVITIEGRDQDNGWGGGTFELTLIRS